MKQKRYCEECGNLCEEEYCPICGRKTRLYTKTNTQDAAFLDQTKYEYQKSSTRETRKDSTSYQRQEKKKQEETFDEQPHQTGKGAKKKPMHLHMEAGRHPYYEHVQAKAPSNSIMAVFRIVAIAIMVAVIAFIAFSASTMMGLGSNDDDYTYSDNEMMNQPVTDVISLYPELTEETQNVKLGCSVKEEKDKSMLTFQNDSSYLVGVNIMKDDNVLDYVLLPAKSRIHHQIYEKTKTCDYQTLAVYSLEGVDAPAIAYHLDEEQKGGFITTKVMVKEKVDRKQLEKLMRYLYEDMIIRGLVDNTTMTIVTDEGDTTLFIVNLDYYRGTMDFERIDADFDMDAIEIIN